MIEVDSNFDPIDFRVNSGSVTIGAATAVPEPSSLVLAVCAIGMVAAFHRRRQRFNTRDSVGVSTHAQVSSFNRVGNTPRFREVNVGA